MQRVLRATNVILLALLCAASVTACSDGEPTDEDLIDKLIEGVTGKVDGSYAQRALGYVDFERFPLDVSVPHHQGVYDAERAPEVKKAFRRAVDRDLMNSELRVRGKKVEIEGDQAEISLNIVSRLGFFKLDMTARRAEPGVWKVSRVHVIR
jgi:hypothetical protein